MRTWDLSRTSLLGLIDQSTLAGFHEFSVDARYRCAEYQQGGTLQMAKCQEPEVAGMLPNLEHLVSYDAGGRGCRSSRMGTGTPGWSLARLPLKEPFI